MSLSSSGPNVRGNFSRNSASQGSSQSNSISAEATDIVSLVKRYRRLIDLLFPFKVAWDASLYIVRWKNYPLTVTIAFILSVLFYCPALFLSCLTFLSIVAMGVGKYYSQTKKSSILKTRNSPNELLLDQELQELHGIHKEQKNCHLVLLEYKQIIQNFEGYILLLTKYLDYLYRIVLWKSPEVSLCVTVLLCLSLVLFCTIYLRVVAPLVPILILCLNRHFLSRTVELWKRGVPFVYHLVRVKPNKPLEVSGSQARDQVQEEQQSEEGVMGNGQLESEGGRGDRSHSNESVEIASSTASVSQGDTDQSSSSTTVRDSVRPSGSSNALASCANCSAPFTFIKRRHKCSSCGIIFCGSCTTKVKRALLGATAPAAFEESVRVCRSCRTRLESIQEELNRNRTTSTH